MSEPPSAPSRPTQLMPGHSALHPASILVAWLETIVRGRRVALLGDATLGLAEGLAERGARLVHAYDPDPGRAAEASVTSGRITAPRPVFAPLEGELGVRDGAFDVVVVPDLGLFQDAAEVVRKARRLLSPSGVAVVASRNPDAARWLVRSGAVVQAGPSYYDLYDLISLQFGEVKMLGQTPFVGYALVDFAAEEPDVTVDASMLAEPESPEWYVAVAGDHAVEVDAYSLIELPYADVASGLAGGEPTTLRRNEIEADRQLLDARVRELETELRRVQENQETTAGASRDREVIATRMAEAERELVTAVGRMREAEARAADTHVRAERLSTELREMDDELRRQRERAIRLGRLLDEEKRSRARTLEMPMPTASPSGPVSESAAVTIRPEPRDDARRGRPQQQRTEDGLREELARAFARIAELERTQRDEVAPPPTIEPVTVEPATLDRERVKLRLAEAEERTRRMEARVAEREARAAEAERKLVAALEQREAIEARLAAVEPELAALRAGRDRLEARRAAAEASEAEARSALQRAHAKADDLGRRAEELARRASEFEARARSAADAGALVRAQEEEVDRLEKQLRDRGREIARLQGELREGLRVGKELLGELVSAGVIPASGAAGGGDRGANGEATDGAAASLADRAARAHADLVGAAMKIESLEHEVRRLRTTRGPDEARRELERALVLAHEEIAELRQGRDQDAVPAGPVVEQQVLFAQLDAMRAEGGDVQPGG